MPFHWWSWVRSSSLVRLRSALLDRNGRARLAAWRRPHLTPDDQLLQCRVLRPQGSGARGCLGPVQHRLKESLELGQFVILERIEKRDDVLQGNLGNRSGRRCPEVGQVQL